MEFHLTLQLKLLQNFPSLDNKIEAIEDNMVI